MKYFYLLIIFLILLSVWQLMKFVLLKRFLRAYVLKKVLTYHSMSENGNVFSSYILIKLANLICYEIYCKKTYLINLLENNNYEHLINYIAKKNIELAYALAACLKIKASKSKLQKYIKQNSKNTMALIVLAMIYANEFEFIKLRQVIGKLKKNKLKQSEKAIVYILEAKIDMFDTDMFSASQKIFKSIRFFKKKKWFYEEAEAYVLLGEIYRISAVYDVSQTMFDAAQEIYSAIKNSIKVSDVKTFKAILFIGEERFAEAKELLCESQKVFKQNMLSKRCAEVLNQRALIYALQKKYAMAIRFAQQALEIHQNIKNIRGQSFSYEIISLSEYNRKSYDKSYDYALLAMSLYAKSKNYAAFEDSAFLAAQSCFAVKKYEQAESICRKIISSHNKNNTCFHIANVYSLLGLIYIRLNEFNRASALFKKSLNLEQCNERYSAAATDYVNLALIDKKTGRLNNALYNLQAALDIAKKENDEKLCAIIEMQIKKINRF